MELKGLPRKGSLSFGCNPPVRDRTNDLVLINHEKSSLPGYRGINFYMNESIIHKTHTIVLQHDGRLYKLPKLIYGADGDKLNISLISLFKVSIAAYSFTKFFAVAPSINLIRRSGLLLSFWFIRIYLV
jgi:hypothetical protein